MQEEGQTPECFAADPAAGLSEAQAAERRAQGLTNKSVSSATKTTGDIIKENVFTYFNGIFLMLAVLLIMAGSFRAASTAPFTISAGALSPPMASRAMFVISDICIPPGISCTSSIK